MALVSLGSCLFTINSTFGFIDGPMSWDSSRVAAAIPSGVGFLGAGLIFKEADKDNITGDTTHVVHGLTTAASLWIVRWQIAFNKEELSMANRRLMHLFCHSFVYYFLFLSNN
jgi:hypothetical protein